MKCKCQKSNTTVYELLQFDSVPDYLKLFYPFADTPKSMIHDEITTLLMTDCVTAKTFYEIGQTIASFRLQKYVQKRAQYYALMSSFKVENTIHEITSQVLSH